MHDNERDIVDAIDEVTGPDAARWPARTHDDTSNASDGFGALLLGMEHGEVVTLDPDKADDKVRDLVGDPYVTHIEPITGVDFWLGDSGMVTSTVNVAATHLFGSLIRDVVDGDYAVSDTDRAYGQELLAAPQVLFGPCLITGVNRAGDGPGPLSDAFWHWLDRYTNRVAAELDARHIAALLRRHGIPPEAVGGIVIIRDTEPDHDA